MQFFSFDKTQSNKPFTTLGLLVVKDKFRNVNFEAYVCLASKFFFFKRLVASSGLYFHMFLSFYEVIGVALTK